MSDEKLSNEKVKAECGKALSELKRLVEAFEKRRIPWSEPQLKPLDCDLILNFARRIKDVRNDDVAENVMREDSAAAILFCNAAPRAINWFTGGNTVYDFKPKMEPFYLLSIVVDYWIQKEVLRKK